MAQVTYGTPTARRIVFGDVVNKYFVVNGASGSTLPTGLQNIIWVENQTFNQAGTASVVSGLTVSGGTVTITSTGTMVNEVINVVGREG